MNSSFRVNDYLELRLEAGRTNIYVNGNVFKQCRYLLLNLEKGEEYGDINSIDEAAMTLDPSLEHPNIEIDPVVEFWGHCSNLQAWSENNYDTRLLHSNIAFPLLKALSKAGDPIAKGVFKEEIAQRIIEDKYGNVTEYLVENNYLSCFNKEELDVLISNFNNDDLKRGLKAIKILGKNIRGIEPLLKKWIAENFDKSLSTELIVSSGCAEYFIDVFEEEGYDDGLIELADFYKKIGHDFMALYAYKKMNYIHKELEESVQKRIKQADLMIEKAWDDNPSGFNEVLETALVMYENLGYNGGVLKIANLFAEERSFSRAIELYKSIGIKVDESTWKRFGDICFNSADFDDRLFNEAAKWYEKANHKEGILSIAELLAFNYNKHRPDYFKKALKFFKLAGEELTEENLLKLAKKLPYKKFVRKLKKEIETL